MTEEFELCLFEYGKPVYLLELRSVVILVWEVESDSGCQLQNGLQSSCELLVDHTIEDVPIIQFICDKCASDVFSVAGREPFEDFPEHLQGVEAGD